jgi:hypothetical protein
MSINIETIKTLADAKKVLTDDQIISAIKSYLKNREYHKAHNQKNAMILAKAKAAGITV